jgi:plastocyanin
VIWLRAALLAVIGGLVVLAAGQRSPQSASPPAAAPDVVAPTPLPARIPLPTPPPQMITSRIARETPEPRATATPSGEPRVSLVDNGFMPGQLLVQVNASVSWVNTGSEGHEVTGSGPGGVWRSGPLAPSERYQRQFSLPGTYDYACTVHPEMRGRVVVVQP